MLPSLTHRRPQREVECAGAPPTDRRLIRRFVGGDESAFTQLVERHAGLVMGVCRSALRQAQDAEDAFQATFLVLARRAKTLDWQESIAGWLHQTAQRTALKLRSTRSRQRTTTSLDEASPEANAVSLDAPDEQASLRELSEVLHAELAALPERFREPVLLTQVEGLKRDEAAERLGITVPAVKDRLERGREMLRTRLVRRGVTLSGAALATWVGGGAVSAATVAAGASAAGFATGVLATGTSPAAAGLAHGVLHMMGWHKFKTAAVWMLSLATAGGAALGVLQDEPRRFERGLSGEIVAVSESPRTVTIELEEFGTLLNLDVAEAVDVQWAFASASYRDLRAGQFVSLRLADDHRTVNEVHVRGEIREGEITRVDPAGRLTITPDDDDDSPPVQVELSPDAILRIGGLPATITDLQPGMDVPLELGHDGRLVHAIETGALEETLSSGRIVAVDVARRFAVVAVETEDEQLIERTWAVDPQAIIALDGRPATVDQLPPQGETQFRTTPDGAVIRAIEAQSPEPDDD